MPKWPIAEITKLLEPSLAHMGYSIYAIEQSGQNGRTLRIAIDKPEGFISLDDCERVSQVAGPLLDQANLIPQSQTAHRHWTSLAGPVTLASRRVMSSTMSFPDQSRAAASTTR